jgi:hypothetical protein
MAKELEIILDTACRYLVMAFASLQEHTRVME